MSSYDKMCKRLVSYRNSLGLYQKDLGQLLGVTQEQYSYIENGATKITDAHLRVFAGLGIDIDFLVTGESLTEDVKELDYINELFQNESDKDFALKIIAEITLRILKKSDDKTITRSDHNMLVLLAAYLEEWDNFSMMTFVRLSMNNSQLDMAQLLGIGIKKYRAFEKETRFPDAELLIELYNMSGYPPSLFLNICDRKMLLLKKAWKLISSDNQNQIIALANKLKMVM